MLISNTAQPTGSLCRAFVPLVTFHCHPAFSSGIGRDETVQTHGPNLSTRVRMATYETAKKRQHRRRIREREVPNSAATKLLICWI